MAEQATDLFSNVLVAIDDSEISLSAISAVIPSVKAAKGKMSVVFVRHRPVMFDSAGAESANAWELIEESLTEREKDSERDASALLAGQGITSTFVVRDGDPAREILATATEHESSVVVLGAPCTESLARSWNRRSPSICFTTARFRSSSFTRARSRPHLVRADLLRS